MRSVRPSQPNHRSNDTVKRTSRGLLGLAAMALLMAIASVTWAPTVALGAGDRATSSTSSTRNAAADTPATRQFDTEAASRSTAHVSTSTHDVAVAPDRIVVAQNTVLPAANSGLAQRHAQNVNATTLAAAETAKAPVAIASDGYRSPGNLHKISVSDAKLVQSIKAQGGRVIADYGSFVLMEANGTVASSVTGSGNAEVVDENNLIQLNAGAIDTTTPAAQAQRGLSGAGPGKGMRLIQFAGPIRPEWYQALVATGARIVTYIPNNAYLVYGQAQQLQAVQQLASDKSIAQWDGDYVAAHRIDPAITPADAKADAAQGANAPRPNNLSEKGNEQFTIQMVDDPAENAATLALIEQYRLEPIIKQNTILGYLNVRVTLPRDVIFSKIAQRVDVVSIQQWNTPKKRDERQNIIITGNVSGSPAVPAATDYLAYLAGKGFAVGTTAAFAVNLSDSGVDNATTTPNHFGLYNSGNSTAPANSRIIYNRLVGTAHAGSTLQGCDGHGNENSHIIGGYVPSGTVSGVNFSVFPHADAQGFRYGLGIAPFVKIGSSVIFDPNTFTSPNYSNLESQAYNNSARISSNSWGANTSAYTADSQEYDLLVRDAQPAGSTVPAAGNQEYVIAFAAGNSGPGAGTVGEPSTAKNVITVGAAENVNPFSGADGCGIDDTGANDANDIIYFSGRGPTADGRRKPDIVAPGTHVSAGAAQASIVSPPGNGNGAQLPCFDGTGVCGGVASNFFPAGQQWYTASSGTSHSTPAIAGVAALIRQHFINQALPTPSPAMTKGLMMNSARYMTGAGANDTLPSNSQGMGSVSLNSYFDIFATAHSLHDQRPADTFTATGQQRVITGTVADTGKPFRVTLVWTDVPGPTSGAAYVNNLDLEVTVGGNTYKGNVFSGAFSATGGTADTRNNVESVVIPAGVSGTFVIKVKATNIAGDGVPGDANLLDQDFALITYNGTESPLPAITGGTTTVTAENFLPANSTPDPAESVTVDFPMLNIGLANTTSLVATLMSSGGITPVTTSQPYGALVAGGAAVTMPFSFVANGACGATDTATFQLQDGAQNLGTVNYPFRLGTTVSNSMTFTNATLITIPATGTGAGTGAPATPYPSTITVAGATSTISKITVTLNGFNHTFPSDVDVLLVSPTGRKMIIMSDVGNSLDAVNATITLDDAAAVVLPSGNGLVTGTYQPANFNTVQDPFPAPAPVGPYLSPTSGGSETLTSAFTGPAGGDPNGVWSLYVVDDAGTDIGTITGGWSITLTNITNVCSIPPAIALVSAQTRRTHGIAGAFDLPLTLTVPPVINHNPVTEARQGPAHNVVFTFNGAVLSATATVTEGAATPGVLTYVGNEVLVPLTGVTDQQYVTVSLTNITTSGGPTGVTATARIGFLLGDVNQSRVVTLSDVGLVNAQLAQPASPSNFLKDVNVSGSISVSDKGLTNGNLTRSLGAP